MSERQVEIERIKASADRFRTTMRELESAIAETDIRLQLSVAYKGGDVVPFVRGPYLAAHRAVMLASEHLSVQLYMTPHDEEPDVYWIEEQ